MSVRCLGAARSSIRLLRLQNVIAPPLATSIKVRPSLEPALHTRIKFIHFGASARTAESPRTQDQSPGQLPLQQQSQHCGSPRTQDQSPAQLPLQQRSQHCGTSDQIGSPRTQDQSPAQLPLQQQSQHCGTSDQIGSKKVEEGRRSWGSLPYIAIGAGIGAVAAPVALTAVGFTGAGIAAGSVAASMMKASAIFYGGGVPAGGAVAILQSLGATMGGSYLGAAVGFVSGYTFHRKKSGGGKDAPKDAPKE